MWSCKEGFSKKVYTNRSMLSQGNSPPRHEDYSTLSIKLLLCDIPAHYRICKVNPCALDYNVDDIYLCQNHNKNKQRITQKLSWILMSWTLVVTLNKNNTDTFWHYGVIFTDCSKLWGGPRIDKSAMAITRVAKSVITNTVRFVKHGNKHKTLYLKPKASLV